jgi:hypothetical protein
VDIHVPGHPASQDIEADTRIVLDLAIGQLGGRGDGDELFALERRSQYHHAVLARVAHELEGEFKMSRLTGELKGRSNEMARHVLRRLRGIVVDGVDDLCRYCGKDGVGTRCSRCRKAHLCPECHTLAWKYHEKWCAA